jgi:2-oxoglutarate ferredoxin oxidoreductase subunit gamma
MTAQSDKNREQRVLIAGFGGQGILTLGKLLCNAAISEGKNVTYMPSYGTEVRGGTCNCHVVISPEEIFSPYVETADSLIILNELSYERFHSTLRPGGLLVVNTSMVQPSEKDNPCRGQVLGLPATETAGQMGNVLVANVILLGAFVGATGICGEESIELAIREWLSDGKGDKIPLNLDAFRRGLKAGHADRSGG